MKEFFITFWAVLLTLLSATYVTIGVNKVILGCYPSRQFIYLVLIISSIIGIISALASAYKIK